MRYVIVGCGPVGQELARRWTAAGHHVIGTTASPSELPRVAEACTEAIVIAPGDDDQIREVTADADGAVLATRPGFLYARPPRERVAAYRQSMINVVRAAAGLQRRLVLFSSIAVYGDGRGEDGPLTEPTPVTTSLDPAAQSFAAVERMVLQSPESAVLRLPDAVIGHAGVSTTDAALFGDSAYGGSVHGGVAYGGAAYGGTVGEAPGGGAVGEAAGGGAGAPAGRDAVTALRELHRQLAGTLPFEPDALIHAIDYRDAAAAAAFAMAHDLTGVYNVVPAGAAVPAAVLVGKLAADAGLPPFTFAGKLPAPLRPVSSAKLRDAGFTFAFPHP